LSFWSFGNAHLVCGTASLQVRIFSSTSSQMDLHTPTSTVV
jgi:hypothetical protein